MALGKNNSVDFQRKERPLATERGGPQRGGPRGHGGGGAGEGDEREGVTQRNSLEMHQMMDSVNDHLSNVRVCFKGLWRQPISQRGRGERRGAPTHRGRDEILVSPCG